jgi:hypothetical protein
MNEAIVAKTRKRRDDWDIALFNEIERQRQTPFRWSSSDCLTFALDCVRIQTGEDMQETAAKAVGRSWPKYGTAEDAYAALHDAGYASLADFLNAHFLPIHPAWAGRGDLALIVHDQGLTAGIFIGDKIACKEPAGVAFVERSRAVKAWRV